MTNSQLPFLFCCLLVLFCFALFFWVSGLVWHLLFGVFSFVGLLVGLFDTIYFAGFVIGDWMSVINTPE